MRNERLEQLMQDALMARAGGGPNANPPASQRKVPRASSLARGCTRLDYFYLTGAPEDPMDALGAAATTGGQALEEDVLDDLEVALRVELNDPAFAWDRVEGSRQHRVETDWFRGSADAWNAKYKILADSKTANPDSWDIKRKQGDPGEDYRVQLNLYGSALGAERIIIPIRAMGNTRRKGGAVYLAYDMKPEPDLVIAARGRAEVSIASAKVGVAPDRDWKKFPATHWLCKDYCSARTVCNKGGN